MNNGNSTSVPVKIYFHNNTAASFPASIRRIVIDPDISFAEFQLILRDLQSNAIQELTLSQFLSESDESYTVSYLDFENDWVTIASESEWRDVAIREQVSLCQSNPMHTMKVMAVVKNHTKPANNTTTAAQQVLDQATQTTSQLLREASDMATETINKSQPQLLEAEEQFRHWIQKNVQSPLKKLMSELSRLIMEAKNTTKATASTVVASETAASSVVTAPTPNNTEEQQETSSTLKQTRIEDFFLMWRREGEKREEEDEEGDDSSESSTCSTCVSSSDSDSSSWIEVAKNDLFQEEQEFNEEIEELQPQEYVEEDEEEFEDETNSLLEDDDDEYDDDEEEEDDDEDEDDYNDNYNPGVKLILERHVNISAEEQEEEEDEEEDFQVSNNIVMNEEAIALIQVEEAVEPEHPFQTELNMLRDMGFGDMDRNRKLLEKFKGNVSKVVAQLIQ